MNIDYVLDTIPGLLWWLSSKESVCNAGDAGSIPRLERSLGEGNGNSLQYSCLGNPMDRGAWRATVHGVTRVGHNLATKKKTKAKAITNVILHTPDFLLKYQLKVH